MANWVESNPKLTSQALVYHENWCTHEERIWFGDPRKLRWFQEEAASIGAIGPNSVLHPFVLPDYADLNEIDDAIRGAVNAVRMEVQIRFK